MLFIPHIPLYSPALFPLLLSVSHSLFMATRMRAQSSYICFWPCEVRCSICQCFSNAMFSWGLPGSSVSAAPVPISRSRLTKECWNCFANKKIWLSLCTYLKERGWEWWAWWCRLRFWCKWCGFGKMDGYFRATTNGDRKAPGCCSCEHRLIGFRAFWLFSPANLSISWFCEIMTRPAV